jgi:hypothetical protein
MNARYSRDAIAIMGASALRAPFEIARTTVTREIYRPDGRGGSYLARVPFTLPRVFWLERPEPPQRPRA